MLFWALRKHLVLEGPVPPGKGGALANPGSGGRKWALPGASCASALSVASPHLCMSHRPWLEGAGGKGSQLFTGHASTLPGEGPGGQNWKVGGVGGREGTSSLSEVTRGIPLNLGGQKLFCSDLGAYQGPMSQPDWPRQRVNFTQVSVAVTVER